MSSPELHPGRISPFIRVLAWILLVCSLLGAAGMAYTIATVEGPEATKIAWLMLALILLMAPLWAYAAIKGRAPRWIVSAETLADDGLNWRRTPPTRKKDDE